MINVSQTQSHYTSELLNYLSEFSEKDCIVVYRSLSIVLRCFMYRILYLILCSH